jgi:CheY-like chemotaxis protein
MVNIENYINLGPLVMVVDDDPVSNKVMQSLLRRAGYGTIVCESGVEALNLLYEYAPIITICDFEMPELDGIQFFLQARAIKPYLRGILYSGVVNYEVLTNAVEGGFDDCLVKPIAASELYSALQRSSVMARHWRIRYDQLGDGRGPGDSAVPPVPPAPTMDG